MFKAMECLNEVLEENGWQQPDEVNFIKVRHGFKWEVWCYYLTKEGKSINGFWIDWTPHYCRIIQSSNNIPKYTPGTHNYIKDNG